MIECMHLCLHAYEFNAINNVTRGTDVHSTLLAYAHGQICLPHCIYLSHCSIIVLYIYNAHTSKIKFQLLFTTLLTYICQQHISPLKWHIYHIWKLVHVQIQSKYTSIFTSNKLIVINNMTRNTTYIISHYCHMPMNIYSCHIAQVCSTVCLLYFTYKNKNKK